MRRLLAYAWTVVEFLTAPKFDIDPDQFWEAYHAQWAPEPPPPTDPQTP